MTQFSQRRRWSPAGREECDEFAARDGYQQDNVHKEVVHDIKQLQDGLDITSGTDVFSNPERKQGAKSPRRGGGEQAVILDTQIHNPSSPRERDNDGSCSAESSRVTQRSSGCTGERVSQKHQQQGNGAHTVSETKKIETYKTYARNPRPQKKHAI